VYWGWSVCLQADEEGRLQAKRRAWGEKRSTAVGWAQTATNLLSVLLGVECVVKEPGLRDAEAKDWTRRRARRQAGGERARRREGENRRPVKKLTGQPFGVCQAVERRPTAACLFRYVCRWRCQGGMPLLRPPQILRIRPPRDSARRLLCFLRKRPWSSKPVLKPNQPP